MIPTLIAYCIGLVLIIATETIAVWRAAVRVERDLEKLKRKL